MRFCLHARCNLSKVVFRIKIELMCVCTFEKYFARTLRFLKKFYYFSLNYELFHFDYFVRLFKIFS